jgi:hypothetical protein
MMELVVGVVLTAALGGVLVPAIQALLDRRRVRFAASVDLLEMLATSLWTYWKLAMRVSYYGRKAPIAGPGYETALERWDSDEAWVNGSEIQVQVSRSKRLLPEAAHADLDKTQRAVVDDLDLWVDHLRDVKDPKEWDAFYLSLKGAKRRQIEEMLARLGQHLELAQRSWIVCRWRQFRRKTPDDMKLHPEFVVGPPKPAGTAAALGADDGNQASPGSC